MEKDVVTRSISIALFVWVGLVAGHADAQISVGLVSDFQTGTTQGWTSGTVNPNPPTVLLGGHGPGDHVLEVVSTGGFGPGGRLVTFNVQQWTGDYLAAGVASVSMDLNNVGTTDLDIRLAVTGAGGPYSTNASVFLVAGSGWTSFVFPVGIDDWTPVGGTSLNATLIAVSAFRILNSSAPAFAAVIEAGDLLVDNITAEGQACYPDCDTSTGVGTLDLFDFLCFQNSFVNGEVYACDCDTSTGPLVCDLFDFLCFQNAFVGGCP